MQGKKDEAISAFNEALSIFEPFEAKNPGTYTEKIESIKSKLAELTAQ